MSKTNKSIEQTANRLFATTTHKKLWANPRGEFFTSENLCNLSLKRGEKALFFEAIEAVNIPVKDDTPTLNAKDSIATINEATSLEVLKPFETDERKTVKEAYQKKYAELLAAIEAQEEE